MNRLPLLALACGLSTAASASAAIFGVDVSNSGQDAINWSTVKSSSNVQFAWAKTTDGVTFNDANASTYIADATAAKFLIGAYHFAEPQANTGASEAAHLISRGNAINAFKNDGLHLLPMLDLESGSSTQHVGSSSLATWAIAWAQGVQAGLGTTRKLPLYINGNYRTILDDDPTNYAKLPQYFELWFAKYSTAPIAADCGPWGTYSLWQYNAGGDTPGIGNVDHDLYEGTLAQFSALYVIPEPTTLAALTLATPLIVTRRKRA